MEEAFHDKETALAHMAARISGLEADLSLELDRVSVLNREIASVDEVKGPAI